jgi:hypothetical protein
VKKFGVVACCLGVAMGVSAMDFYVATDALDKYKDLRKQLEVAQKELSDWLATGPQQSQENNMKYTAMNKKISELKAKLSEF